MKRLRLIDDDPVSIFTVKTMVKKVSPETEFSSFTEADYALEEIVEEIQKGSVPDILFVDINMPIMDGWDFLKELEAYADSLKDTKIFVLSSSVNPADRDRAENCQMVTGYIIKPITREYLSTLITA